MRYFVLIGSLVFVLFTGALAANDCIGSTLVGYWRFDEGSGSVVHDETDYHNDGTIKGATWTTGWSGWGLYYHGGGQFHNGDGVTVPNSPSLDITGPFRVEAWIKAKGSDRYHGIVDKYHSIFGTVSYGFTLYLSWGKLRLTVYSGFDGHRDIHGTSQLRDNTWHHVAGTYDCRYMRLYVDGQLESEVEWPFPPASTPNNLGIGKRLGGWGGFLPFLGVIDEVRLYSSRVGCGQANVVIPNTECVNPGEYVCVPILLENHVTAFGGFELEVEFDYTSMTFVGAEPGELIEGFEKFTYRLLPCPACGCCKYKILLYGQYDIPNGVGNIGEPIPMTEPGESEELVNLCFVVNNDENLRGLKIPVCWEWEGTVVNDTLVEDWECGENTFSSWSGDTLFTSMLRCQFNPDICDDPGDRIQPVLVFQDGICGQNCGGIDICPAGPGECKRGDINMNDMTHEVADAVLLASYFVEGTSVFRYDEAYQICATDVNADGRTLTLSDLVYLIRVILHDAVEIPKLTPSSEVVDVIVSNGTISTECAAPIGAILFEFDGAVNPTLLADMEMVAKDNKVLVWSSKGKSFSTAEVLTFEGEAQLVTATAVDQDSRELQTSIVGKATPIAFALHPAYPNPFNPFTNLSFTLPGAMDYSLRIYNVTGQLVRSYEGTGSIGLNTISWDSKDNAGTEVASGVYFYRLSAGHFSATRKMVVMK